MAADRSNALATAELVDWMKKLEDRLNDQANLRHTYNNAIQSTFTSIERKVHELDELRGLITSVADTVNRIEVRVAGDSKLGSVGLTQELVDTRNRMAIVESDVEDIKGSIKGVKTAVIIITGLGGLVAFIQSTGAWRWLNGPKS